MAFQPLSLTSIPAFAIHSPQVTAPTFWTPLLLLRVEVLSCSLAFLHVSSSVLKACPVSHCMLAGSPPFSSSEDPHIHVRSVLVTSHAAARKIFTDGSPISDSQCSPPHVEQTPPRPCVRRPPVLPPSYRSLPLVLSCTHTGLFYCSWNTPGLFLPPAFPLEALRYGLYFPQIHILKSSPQ